MVFVAIRSCARARRTSCHPRFLFASSTGRYGMVTRAQAAHAHVITLDYLANEPRAPCRRESVTPVGGVRCALVGVWVVAVEQSTDTAFQWCVETAAIVGREAFHQVAVAPRKSRAHGCLRILPSRNLQRDARCLGPLPACGRPALGRQEEAWLIPWRSTRAIPRNSLFALAVALATLVPLEPGALAQDELPNQGKITDALKELTAAEAQARDNVPRNAPA